MLSVLCLARRKLLCSPCCTAESAKKGNTRFKVRFQADACLWNYFRQRPEGLEEREVFVCEWRYTSRQRNWKKIKTFWEAPEHVRIVARE